MDEPLYLKIYQSLKQDIENGVYKPGDQVPTEGGLADLFHVSKITSKRALNMLAEEGILSRQKGRGTFVSHSTSSLTGGSPVKASPFSGDLLPRIGLIYPELNDHFGLETVTAITDVCHGKAHLFFSLSHDDPKREEEAILSMSSAPVDGLIVFPGTSQFLNPRLLQMVIDKYPLVLIDQNIQVIRQTSVGTDNVLAVSQGLSYITSHGHRNIGFLLPNVDNSVLQERCDAVFQYSAITGFPLNQKLWIKNLGSSSDHITEEMIHRIACHLTEHPEITALFALQYSLAVAAEQAAQRVGRVIGKDLSILCFDSPLPLFGKPRFTHLHQDEQAIGEKAVELLLELIQHPGQPPQNIKIPAKLIEGESFFAL